MGEAFSELEIDYESPQWHQGYQDGWDEKPRTRPEDPTYCDGHETGDAEKAARLNRDGSLADGSNS